MISKFFMFRIYDRWRSLTAPWLWLAIALALCAGLAVTPPRFTGPLKHTVAEALVPGQRLAIRIEHAVRKQAATFVPTAHAGAIDPQRLQGRIRELEHQLASRNGSEPSYGKHDGQHQPAETSPLIDSKLISARILGQQARQFLSSRALLDVGHQAGVADGAVVLDPAATPVEAPLLDVGEQTGVSPGRLVMDSATVVGRLGEVGRHTSCLERVTDASYRDLVRIMQLRDGRSVPGARGLLVGTGEEMCRVRMVDISQPVTVGDVVVADGLGGILSSPPRYGTVVRVAQSPGSAHWDIWVQPDADVRNLDVVSVLRTDISALRVAGAPHMTQGM